MTRRGHCQGKDIRWCVPSLSNQKTTRPGTLLPETALVSSPPKRWQKKNQVESLNLYNTKYKDLHPDGRTLSGHSFKPNPHQSIVEAWKRSQSLPSPIYLGETDTDTHLWVSTEAVNEFYMARLFGQTQAECTCVCVCVCVCMCACMWERQKGCCLDRRQAVNLWDGNISLFTFLKSKIYWASPLDM